MRNSHGGMGILLFDPHKIEAPGVGLWYVMRQLKKSNRIIDAQEALPAQLSTPNHLPQLLQDMHMDFRRYMEKWN